MPARRNKRIPVVEHKRMSPGNMCRPFKFQLDRYEPLKGADRNAQRSLQRLSMGVNFVLKKYRMLKTVGLFLLILLTESVIAAH